MIYVPSLSPEMAEFVLQAAPTGSRVIVDPPILNTDDDYVLRVSNLPMFTQMAEAAGWSTRQAPSVPMFQSYRKGVVNLIVTESVNFFDRFEVATALARRFNLAKKSDRIAVFQAVLYAEKYEVV